MEIIKKEASKKKKGEFVIKNYLNSSANAGFNFLFSICCLVSSAVIIAHPPRTTLAIPNITVVFSAPAVVTPNVPTTRAHGILLFNFITLYSGQ